MMLARMLRADVTPDRIDGIVSRYREVVRPIHERAAGLRKHYVLVDRTGGRITIIGVWDSEESLREVAPMLEPARARLWSEFSEMPELETYEVADEL
jgi:heme-degrading monooxygenase HmoA